jgi:hypothetical protein
VKATVADAGRSTLSIPGTGRNGARRFFTLRWTFVPVAGDWLADDAVATPQR